MFVTLLVVTFAIALLVSYGVASMFSNSIRRILDRIVAPDLASAWQRYLIFALYVVGVSGGVRIFSLEQYITPRDPKGAPLVLSTDRWTLEIYRTVIGAMQSIVWMLLVVFVFLLIAYVVTRGLELRAGRGGDQNTPAPK
jgi:hypothetical protein